MEIKTDDWTVQTLRCRESTKEAYEKLITYLGITQDDFLKMSIDMSLEKLINKEKYVNDRQFPHIEQMKKILTEIRNRE